MLDSGTTFLQWENSNELRKYPFDEDSSLVSTCGLLLPDNIISDLIIFYPKSEFRPRLACIKLGPEVISVAFSLGNRLILSCIVAKRSFTPYNPYKMVSSFPGSSGYITFGNITWPESPLLYVFETGATVSSRATIEVKQADVTEFVDDVSGESLSGIVTLNLPDTIVAHVTKLNGISHVSFTLTDVGRTALSSPCHAGTDEEVCGTPVIRSICGVKPNELGQILLRIV